MIRVVHLKITGSNIHLFSKSVNYLVQEESEQGLYDLCFSDLKWRRRESNKRLCFQPNDIGKGILRVSLTDSVWIVTAIEFAFSDSHGDFNL